MIHTIPLRKESMKAAFKKRTTRAVKAITAYVVRHAKVRPEFVIVGEELNEKLWERGITNPPARVQVDITKTKDKDGNDEAFVNLVGFKRKEAIVQKKKGILSKENTGLKGKLQEAVETLKGKAEDKKAESAPEVKPEAPAKAAPVKAAKPAKTKVGN